MARKGTELHSGNDNERDRAIDRITARLRGYQTNREYWTGKYMEDIPYHIDEYITSQVELIARHMKPLPGELVNPSLVIDLWGAYHGPSEWVPYNLTGALMFEMWLDLRHETWNKRQRQK